VPTVVFISHGTEVVGIDGKTECYRRSLDVGVVSYGVGGDSLVVLGRESGTSADKYAVEMLDLPSGKVLARRRLQIRVQALLQGIQNSVLVDRKAKKGYFCGMALTDVKESKLVQFDLTTFEVTHYPIPFPARRMISIDNDLGFCTPYAVYRFTRPPLRQKDGFGGDAKLENVTLYYIDGLGLFGINGIAGTVSQLADPSLHSLVKGMRCSLAGKGIPERMFAVDPVRRVLYSASRPDGEETVLEAVDLARGYVTRRSRIPGDVEQMVVGDNHRLYLVSGQAASIRIYNPENGELRKYASLAAGDAADLFLVWAQ
jgi:hypothetical protein